MKIKEWMYELAQNITSTREIFLEKDVTSRFSATKYFLRGWGTQEEHLKRNVIFVIMQYNY